MIFCNKKSSSWTEWIYVEFLHQGRKHLVGPYQSNIDLALLRNILSSQYSLSADNIVFNYMGTSDLALASKIIWKISMSFYRDILEIE